MIELRYLLASIYRKYDVEMVDMNTPLNYDTYFLTVYKELFVINRQENFKMSCNVAYSITILSLSLTFFIIRLRKSCEKRRRILV